MPLIPLVKVKPDQPTPQTDRRAIVLHPTTQTSPANDKPRRSTRGHTRERLQGPADAVERPWRRPQLPACRCIGYPDWIAARPGEFGRPPRRRPWTASSPAPVDLGAPRRGQLGARLPGRHQDTEVSGSARRRSSCWCSSACARRPRTARRSTARRCAYRSASAWLSRRRRAWRPALKRSGPPPDRAPHRRSAAPAASRRRRRWPPGSTPSARLKPTSGSPSGVAARTRVSARQARAPRPGVRRSAEANRAWRTEASTARSARPGSDAGPTRRMPVPGGYRQTPAPRIVTSARHGSLERRMWPLIGVSAASSGRCPAPGAAPVASTTTSAASGVG